MVVAVVASEMMFLLGWLRRWPRRPVRWLGTTRVVTVLEEVFCEINVEDLDGFFVLLPSCSHGLSRIVAELNCRQQFGVPPGE
mmetsp:Transcript_26299/g.26011  ORF Transcript_26299/g.26011 Transcript_26299/m.26011 type:complete len:83 (+) Transcript_26299:260-508(+)